MINLFYFLIYFCFSENVRTIKPIASTILTTPTISTEESTEEEEDNQTTLFNESLPSYTQPTQSDDIFDQIETWEILFYLMSGVALILLFTSIISCMTKKKSKYDRSCDDRNDAL